MADVVEGPIDHDTALPAQGYAWFVAVVFCLATVLSWVDRQIFALLIPDIKAALELSDTAIGLLHGFSFAMFYTLAGLPLGWLVDRTNRRNLAAAGIGLWSMATAACGLASSFGGLFLARMSVGVGEAVLTPAAVSVISDYFPPKQRAVPLGMFAASGGLGAGLAMLIGGAAVAFAAGLGPIALPWIGTLATWQAAFIIVGLPGLVVAFLMLLVREPSRQGDAAPDVVGWGPFLHFIGKSWKLFAAFGLSYGLFSLVLLATLTWGPIFLQRTQGWSASQVGAALGPAQLLGSILGGSISGLVVNWLQRRGWKDAPLRAMALMLALAALPTALAPLIPDPRITVALWGVLAFVAAFCGGAGLTVVQAVTPNRFRGKLVAVLYTVTNILGMGLGPVVLASLTDGVFGEARIGLSMATLAAIGLPSAAFLAWLGLPHFRRAALS